MTRSKFIISLCLALVLLGSLAVSGCSSPAPSPSPSKTTPPVTTPAKTVAPSLTPSAAPSPKPPASPSPSQAAKPAFKMPSPIISSSLDVGSGGYVIAVAIADAFQKERGVTMRVVPVGTDVGRTALLANGRAHVLFQGYGAFAAFEGVQGFDTQEQGPQPLQVINAGLPTAGNISVTAKDANIKTWADAKGKRVAYIDGYPAVYVHSDLTLAFANLTWNDVKMVKFTSFSAMGSGLIEGTVDVATALTTTAFCYQLASSPRGLQFVPYPFSDKEGWKRAQSLVPIWKQALATQGPGLSKDNPLECGTYPNPHLVTSASADPEFVYQFTKMLMELYPVYGKAQAPGIDMFDPARLIIEYAMPYHAGAIRYYKEIGKWTDAAQKNNDLMLKRQQVLKTAWEDALNQAAVQKVKSDDFPKFWMGVRAKALEAAGMSVYYK